ncbi:maleylacetate reductase [Orrella sp. JC864]|uniref:maleylacetate reductase n=1 Tax=Orrella sp. JC864 TaxID=3120298 RepID=UPI003009C31D
MRDFVYTGRSARVVFGNGALRTLAQELERLGVRRALLVCTARQRGAALALARELGPLAAGVYDQAQMHVPAEVADDAARAARQAGADCAVALGGGSPIGLAKAMALRHPLTVAAVPTTYSGSEMTAIYGITGPDGKQTGSDERVVPRLVIYDPALTLALPVPVAVASGLNAIAHAAEGLYARDGNPVMDIMAQSAIRALAGGLARLAAAPADLHARADCLQGAWLAGMVLGGVGMALHHKLCHTLGGSFGLPHAQTHAVVLPHALAYNALAAPLAMQRIGQALDVPGAQAPAALHALAGGLGAPGSLRELGLRQADLQRAADLTLARPYWNPAPLQPERLRRLLHDAWEGRAPAQD